MNDAKVWITWAIFLPTFAGLALGKAPGLRMDRAGIAMVGATLTLVAGVLSFDEAVSARSIDYKTLALLFGMMIVAGALRISGCFERLAGVTLRLVSSPRGLLAGAIGLSGLLSAFLINDVVCVALTPLVLRLARRLNVDPLPHLIGLATAANIGSVGTITGNPQNIYIGAHSGISYLRFAERLAPVALLGLAFNYLVVATIYRARLVRPADPNGAGAARSTESFGGRDETSNHAAKLRFSRRHVRLQIKAMTVTLGAVVLFFVGAPLELVALGAGAAILVDRVQPKKIYRQVDWGLLVTFTGLFIVVHAFQTHVVSGWGVDRWTWLLDRPASVLSLASAALSNVVSNVPAVLLLGPLAQAAPAATRETTWLALAMSSTLAGNLTILGSVANLIVVEIASRDGIVVSFWEYCKVGVPLTVVTLALGIAWLQFVAY